MDHKVTKEPFVKANGLVTCRFLKSFAAYSRGTVAGFTPEEATRLHGTGHVEYLAPIDAAVPAAAPNPPADPPSDPPPAPPEASTVEIPDDWRLLHHMARRSIAKNLGIEAKNAEEADQAIEAELARRAAAQ
ncbi:MAG: hypothetical protein KIS96_11620 [Bauldia sp.]|nr:hypothetical protein [Bauldia sp.]